MLDKMTSPLIICVLCILLHKLDAMAPPSITCSRSITLTSSSDVPAGTVYKD